jgi:cysteinyl-tRNA synthetase
MEIFLTNTLSGKKEKFIPIESGRAKIYSCGPTVYNFAHIGNFRSFLTSDLLTRVLEYAGYDVKKIMNITDVGHLTNDESADAGGEDKISKTAREQKLDPFEIARKFEEAFREDEKALRIRPADHYPRATEFIAEQIELAKNLIAEDFAYEANGSVYFRTRKFEKYGQLSKNKLEDLVAGARVEVNSEKEDPLDFALWKRAEKNHLMQWDSPWGRGFPGWHVECSAMSGKLLGFPFDIHTGGEDNVFPHHECEIAQNECSSGGQKSVNYWLHTKHLQVEGKKMSKSAGNFFTIRDLLAEGWRGNEIRLALLGAHYRSTLDFSMKSLEQARASIARITEARRVCENTDPAAPNDFSASFRDKFENALADDLNVADALAATFEITTAILKLAADENLDPATAASALDFFENDFEAIFDCLPEEIEIDTETQKKIEKLVADRATAREGKNWAESDRIRDELLEKFNVEVRDGPEGQLWSVKN